MQYHGIECQQRKLVEEVHELNEAITRFETQKKAGMSSDVSSIITEIADVKNLLEQIQDLYNINTIDVNLEKTMKIKRHFKEMEDEINGTKILK
jgi:NTP pyrophosphatase (non-canonical NTP hydrolase)